MCKIKYFLALLLLSFLTGCSSYDMSMKIEKNKSLNYTVTILSNDYSSELSKNISIYKEKLESYGYSVLEYNENNKYGVIISKRFDNIDDISFAKKNEEFNLLYLYSDGYDVDIEKKTFNVDKKIFTNRYIANFYVDLSTLGINLKNASVTYKVELPYEPVSSNANIISEDRKTLTWNITSLGKTEIDYVFDLKSYDYIYFGIAFLIVVFLIILIMSNLFGKSGNNDDNLDKSRSKHDYEKNISFQNVNVNNKDVYDDGRDPESVGLTALNQSNNREINDDITSFLTPIKQKNKSGFDSLNNEFIDNVNEEFNDIINNLNNSKINNENSNANDNNLVNKSLSDSEIKVNVNNNIGVNNDVIVSGEIEGNCNIYNDNNVNDTVDVTNVPVIKVNNKSVFVDDKNEK